CDKRGHVSHKTVRLVEIDKMPAPFVFDKGSIGQLLCELLKSLRNDRSIKATCNYQGRHRDCGEGSKLVLTHPSPPQRRRQFPSVREVTCCHRAIQPRVNSGIGEHERFV